MRYYITSTHPAYSLKSAINRKNIDPAQLDITVLQTDIVLNGFHI